MTVGDFLSQVMAFVGQLLPAWQAIILGLAIIAAALNVIGFLLARRRD